MPIITIIAAIAKNNAIGYKGQLPWDLPDDLKHFRALTLNKPIIMGSKTFHSIGHPLPHRLNIVLSRDPLFDQTGIIVATTLNEALGLAGDAPNVCIIGGGQIYKEAIKIANRLDLTEINASPVADTFFPTISSKEWQETAREHHATDDRHIYSFDFVTYTRISH